MNINTITCHRVYNHGAALQAWALATYLKEQGHSVNIIDYRPDYLRGHYDLRVNNPRYDKFVVRWFYLAAKYPGWRRSLARKAAFDTFDAKFIAPLVTERCFLSAEELKRNPPKADVYIAGSDQIWNTNFKNGTDSSFYLDFGTKESKRISYAASFATSKLREGTENFVKTKLANFDAISVRESSGIKLLEKIGYSGALVCDPVFLIDAEIWKDHFVNDNLEEKYLLVYDFDNGKAFQELALRISKTLGLKIYSLFNIGYSDLNFHNCGPDTFVSLIGNATCVLSNSFHATAFSLILKKNVFVAKREDGLNQRMQDLLMQIGLSNRLIDKDVSDSILKEQIDYENVSLLLEEKKKQSRTWLNNNL
jgi:hypothetical protein